MENYSTIGFYTDINYQIRNLKSNPGGKTAYQNLMPVNKLIPHSFSTAGTLTSAILTSLDGSETSNITAQYSSVAKTGYTVYYNLGTTAIAGLVNKEFYIIYTISGQTYFSDVVTFCPDVSECLSIEWFHLPNTGSFVYSYDSSSPETANGSYEYDTFGFHKFYFHPDVILGMPEYPVEENLETRISKTFPITQISYKLWKFKALLPEYVLDCLRLVRLHSNIVVNLYDDTLTVTDFLLGGTNWIDYGYLSFSDFEFRTAQVSVQHAKFY